MNMFLKDRIDLEMYQIVLRKSTKLYNKKTGFEKAAK